MLEDPILVASFRNTLLGVPNSDPNKDDFVSDDDDEEEDDEECPVIMCY